MKVRAPFVVGRTYKGGLELFSWSMMHTWFDKFEWDYWYCQRLGWQRPEPSRAERK